MSGKNLVQNIFRSRPRDSGIYTFQSNLLGKSRVTTSVCFTRNTMADNEADMSQPPKKSRFASVDERKMEQILLKKDSKNTQKATARSVRLFTEYLQEKDMPTD